MEQISSKRNPFVFVLPLFLFLLGAGFLSYSFLLPLYIEKKLLPDIGRQVSANLTGEAYNIGLSAADFGDISLGNKQEVAVSIGSIHADYSLFSLLGKKLERVKINGLTLHLEVSDGKITIPGINLERRAAQGNEQRTAKQSPGINLPVELGSFHISNALIDMLYEGQRFLLPFDLKVQKDSKQKK